MLSLIKYILKGEDFTENRFIHRIAMLCADKFMGIIRNHTYDSIEKQKLILGIEIFIINVSKLIIVYLFSFAIDCLWKTLAIHFSFVITKRFSFGLHAKNSTVCTLCSLGIFVALPNITCYLTFNNSIVTIIFLFILSAHVMYAPADTAARPLLGIKNRQKLKRKSVLCVVALMMLTLLVKDEYIKTLFTLGAVCQTINILPITYKILKRSDRNYAIYE